MPDDHTEVDGVPDATYVALQRLYAWQSQAIDGGDADRWASSFTEDGVFDSPTYGRPVTGRAELAAFARRVFDRLGASVQRHYPCNLVVQAVAADRVTASCYVQIVVTRPGEAPRLARSVTFTDDVVRVPAGWRVLTRSVCVDGQGRLVEEGARS
jgi:3-phenylpropionate/cinnamic acid dioxygenase small subunit